MSLERDLEAAFIAILRADTVVAAITTSFRKWADESQKRTDLQAMIKAEKPQEHLTGGDGKVWLWKCRVEADPLSYIPDDNTLADLDALYSAVFNATQGITAATLQAAMSGYTVFCLIEDTGERKIEERLSIWSCSKTVVIGFT